MFEEISLKISTKVSDENFTTS